MQEEGVLTYKEKHRETELKFCLHIYDTCLNEKFDLTSQFES